MVSESELFERNIGIFSREQQSEIRNLRVAIAGAGGIGGPVAYGLARLGVKHIKLADPEKFEPSNLNRQFGAYVDTIGEFKAEAICTELKRINPYGEFIFINEALGRYNMPSFLEGVDLVVDGIEFFNLKAELELHDLARKRGLWIHTSQAAAEILTFTCFDPLGTSLAELITKGGEGSLESAIGAFFPELPSATTPELLRKIIAGEEVHISSHSTPPMIGGGLLVEQILNSEVRHADVAVFPKILSVNINQMNMKLY